MARLTPGYNFQTNESLSAAKLHRLVDNSYLVGVAQADLAAGVHAIWTETTPAPQANDVRVGVSGLLEFYVGGVWTTQDPDIQGITLNNNSGALLPKGTVVVPDASNAGKFKLSAGTRCWNALGVLAADTAAGADGVVYVRGRVQALVSNQVNGGIAPIPGGYPLRGPDATALLSYQRLCFRLVSQDPSLVWSDHYGVTLGQTPAENGIAGLLVYVKLGRK